MKYRQIAVAAAMALSASAALAVPVTVVGSSFDITYDNAFLGLFGAPVLVGNQLSWFPSGSPGFTAQTASGFGVTNSTFSVQVTAHPGYQFTGFTLAEAGDYFFFGAGATVSVSGQLRVTPLPGATSTAPISATNTFAANSFLDFSTTNWAATSAVAAAADTTRANLTVQNILASYVPSSTVGYAFIEKKDVFLTVMTAPVPEPETYALMLAGLGVVGFVALRRRKAR